MPVWMKETVSAPMAPPSTVPMPPHGGRAADEDRGEHRQQVSVAGGWPPGEVDHGREDAGERRADAHECKDLHPHEFHVDAHLLRAVGVIADHMDLRAEPVPVVEQRAEDHEGDGPRRSATGIPQTWLEKILKAQAVPQRAERQSTCPR